MPTSQSNKKVIGLTLGDPGGIGPEVLLKSFCDPKIKRHFRPSSNIFFLCIGDYGYLSRLQSRWKKKIPLTEIKLPQGSLKRQDLKKGALNVLTVGEVRNPRFGKPVAGQAKVALESIYVAAQLGKQKMIHAVVTAPVHKAACQKVFPGFLGHTEMLAQIDGADEHAMMLTGGPLRVVLATIHVPLKKVSQCLSTPLIFEKIHLANAFGKKYLKIKRPKIAVCGVNPHAGESLKIGNEDGEIILPAVRKAKKKGIAVSGPFPADTLFYKAYRGDYDFVLAMYHDQGLVPLKMVAFEEGVNTTLGLSYIRTSPDHGTAYDIAGKNRANPRSMVEAIDMAIRLVK